MVGIPAIAFPIEAHSNGMPIGIQLMGKKFEEKEFSDGVMVPIAWIPPKSLKSRFGGKTSTYYRG
jgi:hypothetical protein